MKRICLGLTIVGLFILFQAAPASAEIKEITKNALRCDTNCGSFSFPVTQGESESVVVTGPFVDRHTNLSVTGEGVRPREISKSVVTINSEQMGRIGIMFDVKADAPLGERTVSICYALGTLGCDTFKIRVVPKVISKVTAVNVPPPFTNFFQEADVTLNGEHIGNAEVIVDGEGDARGVTGQITTNTDTRAVVKLRFPNRLAQANVDLKLRNKTTGDIYEGLSSFGNTRVTLIGPIAVKAITFPLGGSFTVGSVATVQIELNRTVQRDLQIGRPVNFDPQRTSPGSIQPEGEVIFWRLIPSDIFEQADALTPYNPAVLFNKKVVTVGNNLVLLSFKVKASPGGQQSVVKIQTWTGNTNTNQPPEFKEATFTIVTPKQ